MSNHRTSIAVLPFDQKGATDEYSFFGEGIGEEIIRALSSIPGLRVCSRRSSFSLAESHLSIGELAKKLNVENILEGSVQVAGDQIRISASLIEAASDETYWSNSWHRPLSNIFEVQDEISLLIADQLREHFGHLEISDHLVHMHTRNIDAFTWELKGRRQFNRWNPKDVHTAIDYFKMAIELDPEYLDPRMGLADAYGFLATTGFGDPVSCWKKAKDELDFVHERDPLHAGLNYQLANYEFFTQASYTQAFHYAKITIQSREGYPEGQQFMAFLNMLRGDMKKAGDHIRYARAIDPLNSETRFYEAYYQYRLHNYLSSIAICDELLATNPQNLPALIVKFYGMILSGKSEPLLRELKHAPDSLLLPDEKLGLETMVYHALDYKDESEQSYAELMMRSQNNSSPQADAYFYL
ncbi:MAG: adenylate cyclase, partial [Bacteroidetes bacterium]